MYCYQCQYNLKHLTRDSCPECGRAFDPLNTQTYLDQPIHALPLLGKSMSAAIASWAARNHVLAFWFWLAAQLGIRTFGISFMVMMLMISAIEGETGRGRTHWENVFPIVALFLIGFYVSHAIIPLLKQGGKRKPSQLWAYALGIVIAVLIFYSPMRP